MIISEKQIALLINFCKDYSVLLSHSGLESAAVQYNRIRDLLDIICNQQSDKLKVIE